MFIIAIAPSGYQLAAISSLEALRWPVEGGRSVCLLFPSKMGRLREGDGGGFSAAKVDRR